MAGRLMAVLLVPVVLAMLLAGILRGRDAFRARGAARVARARSLASSVATAVAGFAATWLWLAWGGAPSQDIRLATLPALAGGVATLTAGVAERTWPQPAGQVRVANLSARQTARHLGLPRLLAVGLTGTGAALLLGGLTAAPDGRSFSRHARDFSATGSPYPGWSYGSVVGLAVVLLALATWFAHRQVEVRPALGPGHEALDEALRRASVVRVLRPAAAGALVTAAGLWLTMGATVNSVTQNLRMSDGGAGPRPPVDWVQDLGLAGLVVGVAMLLLALVALLWSSPRFPRQVRSTAAGSSRAQAEA